MIGPIVAKNVETFPEDLLEWSEDNLRRFPWRVDDASLYEVLVAEMFLSVTRSEVVSGVYEDFIERYPDPDALRMAEKEDLVEIIRPIGLYNRRANALLSIADQLDDPDFRPTEESLTELPHVGPYVANAVLCMALGEDRPMVDRNVARVLSRVFALDIRADDPGERAWEFAEKILPPEEVRRFNLALLDFASEGGVEGRDVPLLLVRR